jgi:hypothetical protein
MSSGRCIDSWQNGEEKREKSAPAPIAPAVEPITTPAKASAAAGAIGAGALGRKIVRIRKVNRQAGR